MLEMLANEDFFQEFVEIDLGHWCGKDLRRMSEDAGTKGDYDRFYGWASGFRPWAVGCPTGHEGLPLYEPSAPVSPSAATIGTG